MRGKLIPHPGANFFEMIETGGGFALPNPPHEKQKLRRRLSTQRSAEKFAVRIAEGGSNGGVPGGAVARPVPSEVRPSSVPRNV